MLVLLAAVLTLSGAASPPAAAVPVAGGEQPDGAFGWPLLPGPDEVVHGFHPPDDPWGAGHRGVDLAGRNGQSVHSAGAGTVTFAGMVAGRGVVTVTHPGGLRTTYEPVHTFVAVGQAVGAGDVIGTLGLVGGHCLPRACLHWGLLRGRTYLDPLSLVGAGPVRLLPSGTPPHVAPAMRTPPAAVAPNAPHAVASAVATPVRGQSVTATGSRARVVGVAGATGLAIVATAVALVAYRRRA